LFGEPGAKIILEQRAYIMFTEGSGSFVTTNISSKSWNNFYSDTSNKETGVGGYLFNKTFNWDANVGGSGNAGWVKAE
jgi:hypothetical protein